LKIVHKKKLNSIKGRLITYGQRTSSALYKYMNLTYENDW
jgi:hypothetical protein